MPSPDDRTALERRAWSAAVLRLLDDPYTFVATGRRSARSP
ncbi:hypothetical protein [Streptomyces sp. NPDC126499]